MRYISAARMKHICRNTREIEASEFQLIVDRGLNGIISVVLIAAATPGTDCIYLIIFALKSEDAHAYEPTVSL